MHRKQYQCYAYTDIRTWTFFARTDARAAPNSQPQARRPRRSHLVTPRTFCYFFDPYISQVQGWDDCGARRSWRAAIMQGDGSIVPETGAWPVDPPARRTDRNSASSARTPATASGVLGPAPASCADRPHAVGAARALAA
jgi:hypothetical protein